MTKSVIAPNAWEMHGARVPVFNWAGDLDDKTKQQAFNLASLPVTFKHVGLMPDAHAGYGMPIGGVLATKNAVVPYAIGVDIGCGVIFVDLHMKKDEVISRTNGTFSAILALTAKGVPTGFNVHKTAYTEKAAIDLIEMDLPESVERGWFQKSLPQLGTLGGGNHFLEFQTDEDDNVFIMLHSGSRSLGKSICDHFHKKALEMNLRYFTPLPDKELAFIPQADPLFSQYWTAMRFGLAWAETNRKLMMEAALKAVSLVLDEFKEATVVAECHHNYAAFEHHYGQDVIVHRKGAVNAAEGNLVLIPGSMGTASYLAEGLGNPESFNTCQHGAGRKFTRTAMHKSTSSDEVYAEMEEKGIALVSSSPADVMEEAPAAYKDIEDVMSRSTDLVKPLKRLTPIGVVKG